METLITLATYVLGFFAVVLTIGFVAWLFVARYIWSEYKKSRADFNGMSERIKKNRELNGKATKHKIDL